MVGWEIWLGKKVFINSSSASHGFEGKVIDVEKTNQDLIFITIKDKFNKRVKFESSSILLIKEEE